MSNDTSPTVPSSGKGGERTEGIQSLDRAVAVLEFLGQNGDASVSDVAHELGVHKSTASRMLAALQTHGLVEVTQLRGRYKLGYGLVRLAGMIGSKLDVVSQGGSICTELAHRTSETVTLTICQEDRAVTIHQTSDGSSSITLGSWLGRPTPLHATSSGKVLLAYMPEDQRDHILSDELVGYTDHTITDPADLRDELSRIRRDGYAASAEEFEVGLHGVAAPIFVQDGTAPCALSVSGPVYRIAENMMSGLVAEVLASAAAISRRMGHHG